MNPDCPKCDGLLMQSFDDNGILIYRCTTCEYSVYPNEDLNIGNSTQYSWTKNVFNKTKEKIIKDEEKFIVVSYLKSVRESRGISQKQIAEIFGFSEQRYGNVERHYNAPSVVLVAQFAYILNVSVGDLYKPIQVPKEMYNDMKYLKIQKSELVPFEELKVADLKLKNAELELKRIIDEAEAKNKLVNKEHIKSLPEYINAHKEYMKEKKVYDKLINSTSTFLKQGELVENTYWEKYLKTRKDVDSIKVIEE